MYDDAGQHADDTGRAGLDPREGAAVNDIRTMTQAVAAGDPEALGRLYDDWFDVMFHIAGRYAGDDEHGRLDLIQEAMVRMIKARPVFDCDAQLHAWLTRTIRHAAIDAARRQQRRRDREARCAAAEAPQRGGDAEPVEDGVWLREELARLDRTASQLLEWRFRFNLTFAEIGRRLRLTPGAAHGRVLRVLARLRSRAEEVADESGT